MKRFFIMSGSGVLFLFVLTALVSGKRVVTDDESSTSVKQQTAELTTSGTLVQEDVHQPQVIPPFTIEATLEPTAYEIPWQSINAGGDNLSSATYELSSSIGQSVVGYATSDNYEAGIGYWYGMSTTECYCGVPGNVDNDGTAPTPLDVTLLVKKVYKSQDALYDYKGLGNCPFENGDVDGGGGAPNPLDVTLLVKKVYKSQDALCADRCSGTPGNCPAP